jgi:hypothetical protein
LQTEAVAHRSAGDQLRNEVAMLAHEAERLRRMIDTMEADIWWRLTSPLRLLLGYFNRK